MLKPEQYTRDRLGVAPFRGFKLFDAVTGQRRRGPPLRHHFEIARNGKRVVAAFANRILP